MRFLKRTSFSNLFWCFISWISKMTWWEILEIDKKYLYFIKFRWFWKMKIAMELFPPKFQTKLLTNSKWYSFPLKIFVSNYFFEKTLSNQKNFPKKNLLRFQIILFFLVQMLKEAKFHLFLVSDFESIFRKKYLKRKIRKLKEKNFLFWKRLIFFLFFLLHFLPFFQILNLRFSIFNPE